MKTLDLKEITWGREYGCSDRIARLRKRIVEARPKLSSQRAMIVTRAYQDYEAEPIIIKRARCFERLLNEMDLLMMPDELILGHMTEFHRSAPVFPEMRIDWLIDELDTLPTRPQDQYDVSDQVKADLLSIQPYWKGKTLLELGLKRIPEPAREQLFFQHPTIVSGAIASGIGHICQNIEKVLKIGFKGIYESARQCLDALDLAAPGAVPRYYFYQAEMIVCNAVRVWGNRYAEKALTEASAETNEARKAELLALSDICSHVPWEPAETFWEALQSVWAVQLLTQLETDGVSISPGRLDQILFPYYQSSGSNGIDIDKQELLEAFWLKFSEIVQIKDQSTAAIVASYPMGQHVLIGGVNEHGDDVTNPLSYRMLDAQLHLRMPQPNFGARLHSASPTEFVDAVARTIRDANTMPQIDNDEVYIPALMERGFTLSEARNYSLEGCNEPGLPGKLYGRGFGGFLNQTKCLELALNDGKCMLTNEQIGPHTGIPDDDWTYKDVEDAYQRQISNMVHLNAIIQNATDVIHREIMPVPFLSSTMDVMEAGMDITQGSCKYNFVGPLVVGIGTTGNSLSAIKDVVFDRRAATLSDVRDALLNNYATRETIRYELLDSPKWCNDIDSVDRVTVRAFDIVAEEMRKCTNERGGPFIISCLPMSSIISLGRNVAATPDGRLSQDILSDSIGAQQGTDVSGPTAAIQSVCKINHAEMANGLIFNMRLNPSSVAGDRLSVFTGLIRTFIRLKGMQIQFNIVDSSVLRAAQKDPEKYRGLTVRVAGYSAFFIDLAKEVQDEIIRRTEHAL